MPLSLNEIKSRAYQFSRDYKDAHYEKGETQSFYNDFFKIFGKRRRDVAVYEEKVKKLNNHHGFIDLFWPGQLLIEQKSAGKNLDNAKEQATDYFLGLKDREKPRYILLSDFQNFQLIDLEENEEHKFTLEKLAENIHHFAFIAGYQTQTYKDQDPANIKALELISRLHEQLEQSGYVGEHLEKLLVRIVFCLFADNTGIFKKDAFLRYIEDRTLEDGSDTGSQIIHIFETLDNQHRQSNLDEQLAEFPYVNGELFSQLIRTPSFDSKMRQALLDCCYYNWAKVSPALFGSLFQSVMLPEDQREGGAHYTSEQNILKTIEPLFLNDLRAEFNKLKARKNLKQEKLQQFHDKLASLKFLDPACGCGNFLILAYRELRLLEIELLQELYPNQAKVLDVDLLSKIDVDQFYGIELTEFASHIARTAMWLVDHQMNMELSKAFGMAYLRLPLQKSAHIEHNNALTIDWNNVISNQDCSYILGNPPFVGAMMASKQQREELKQVFAGIKGAGVLDYVTAWYLKASQYIQDTKIKVAFVSTNSISQGEQTAILWKPLFDIYKIKIHFAHQTFKWTIDEKKAKGMQIANVYCVIIGFANYDIQDKYIYEYQDIKGKAKEVLASNINPYLLDGVDVVIENKSFPLVDNVPNMRFGSMPRDGGHLIFTNKEKELFVKQEPSSEKWLRKYTGAREFLNGDIRWCLWLVDIPPNELKKMSYVLSLLEKVRDFRKKSKALSTQKFAETPALFCQIAQPDSDYVLFPRVSSERRNYIPIGFLTPDVIASDATLIIPHATTYHFGILTSAIHMTWMRYTAGRLKSDYRYSNSIVYNNFPWPENVSKKQQQAIAEKAQTILDIRDSYDDSTLADLYDPLTMPADLLKAHQNLDKAVDKLYQKDAFSADTQRMELLLTRYQKLTAPLIEAEKTKKKRRRKKL
jgi:hypothetical protein